MNISLVQLEKIGIYIDQIDNIIGASQLPMKPEEQMELTVAALQNLSRSMKEVYVEVKGENPWKK